MNDAYDFMLTVLDRTDKQFWISHNPGLFVTNPRSGGILEVLFRRGCLQVERITHGPNETIPMHRHPNVDSYEFPLMGTGELWVRKRVFKLDAAIAPWKPVPISRNCYHGGRSYEQGGSFLSVQYWHVTPVQSVIDDWEDSW